MRLINQMDDGTQVTDLVFELIDSTLVKIDRTGVQVSQKTWNGRDSVRVTLLAQELRDIADQMDIAAKLFENPKGDE